MTRLFSDKPARPLSIEGGCPMPAAARMVCLVAPHDLDVVLGEQRAIERILFDQVRTHSGVLFGSDDAVL